MVTRSYLIRRKSKKGQDDIKPNTSHGGFYRDMVKWNNEQTLPNNKEQINKSLDFAMASFQNHLKIEWSRFSVFFFFGGSCWSCCFAHIILFSHVVFSSSSPSSFFTGKCRHDVSIKSWNERVKHSKSTESLQTSRWNRWMCLIVSSRRRFHAQEREKR